jgi:hypothetical protein
MKLKTNLLLNRTRASWGERHVHPGARTLNHLSWADLTLDDLPLDNLTLTLDDLTGLLRLQLSLLLLLQQLQTAQLLLPLEQQLPLRLVLRQGCALHHRDTRCLNSSSLHSLHGSAYSSAHNLSLWCTRRARDPVLLSRGTGRCLRRRHRHGLLRSRPSSLNHDLQKRF